MRLFLLLGTLATATLPACGGASNGCPSLGATRCTVDSAYDSLGTNGKVIFETCIQGLDSSSRFWFPTGCNVVAKNCPSGAQCFAQPGYEGGTCVCQ
ncbi:MAG TPA: hypothetical protein VMK42_00755 [Anaeromyxobacteraceae bacterium]|nr:hypothetical protein [Anaeromyxobacteraceae bacterium]